jgi:hypothetical protein
MLRAMDEILRGPPAGFLDRTDLMGDLSVADDVWLASAYLGGHHRETPAHAAGARASMVALSASRLVCAAI